MKKSLYLTGAKDLKIKRDGPSLWVTTERGSRRVPVNLVERVVVVGEVNIPSSVVTLFASHNIPVLFIEPTRKETALCLSTKPSAPAYADRQCIFNASDDNRHKYRSLLESFRSMTVMGVLRRLFNNNTSAIEEHLGAVKNFSRYKRLFLGLSGDRKHVFTVARTLLKAILLEDIVIALRRAGFDPQQGVLHQGKRLGLAHDLLFVFEPEVSLIALRFVRSANYEEFVLKERILSEGLRDLVCRYENRACYIRQRTKTLLGKLVRLLQELEHRGTLRLSEKKDERHGSVSYML